MVEVVEEIPKSAQITCPNNTNRALTRSSKKHASLASEDGVSMVSRVKSKNTK